jgi:hypothetical protein
MRFPPAPLEGALLYQDGAEKVRQALWIILDTEPGERVMRPTFGCGLRQWLMQPNTPAVRGRIQRAVAEAVARWEPRVNVQGVTVTEGEDPALVLIHLSYTHVRDGRPENLVYPFYLE